MAPQDKDLRGKKLILGDDGDTEELTKAELVAIKALEGGGGGSNIVTPETTVVGDPVVWDSTDGTELASASPIYTGTAVDAMLNRFNIVKGLVASIEEWTPEHFSTLICWFDPSDTANHIVSTVAISSWTGSGSEVTVNTSEAHGIAVGESVVIAGAGAIDGTYTVATAPTTTSFTITSAETAGGSAAGTVAPVNSRISSWTKKAGSLATVGTQSAFTKMPKRVTGLNNRLVMRFDGTDDFLALTNATHSGDKGFVVFGYHSAESKQVNLLRASASALIAPINYMPYQFWVTTQINTANITNQNPRFFMGGASGGVRRVCLNGGLMVSDTGAFANPDWLALCSNATGSADFANGDVLDWFLLSDMPSLKEMRIIGLWYNSRWGIPFTNLSLYS